MTTRDTFPFIFLGHGGVAEQSNLVMSCWIFVARGWTPILPHYSKYGLGEELNYPPAFLFFYFFLTFSESCGIPKTLSLLYDHKNILFMNRTTTTCLLLSLHRHGKNEQKHYFLLGLLRWACNGWENGLIL